MARTIPKFPASASSNLSMATDWTVTGDFDISFESWFSIDNGVGAVIGDNTSASDFIAYLSSGRLRFDIGGTLIDTANDTVKYGVLTSVQITRVGTAIEMFIDGVSEATGTSGVSLTMNTIGTFSSGTFPFKGFIKDVALIDIDTPSNSRTWVLDEPTASTEDSTQGGNAVTYNSIASTERPLFTEVSGLSWWSDQGDVLEYDAVQNTDLIFEIGQSNAVGVPNLVVGVDDQYSVLTGRIRQFGVNRQIREGAANELDHFTNYSGVRMGHWRTMCIGLSGNILLVPAAKDGAGFSNNNWNSGDTTYNDAIASLNAAFATESGQALKAVVWHQGERDGVDLNASYLADLNAMRTAMIAAVTEMTTDTPWVVITPGDDGSVAFMPNITADLVTFAASLPNGHYIDASDLTLLDQFHYDAAGQRTIGERIAAALEPVTAGGIIKPMISSMITPMISGMIN